MTMKQQLALTLGELFDCLQEVLLVWAKREKITIIMRLIKRVKQ